MNSYVISSLIAFVLFGMGITALILGITNYMAYKESQSGRMMFVLLTCVFLWDFGYAWMSLCYDSDVAYVARAIALLGVYFYVYFLNRYMAALITVPLRQLFPYYIAIGASGVVSWLKIIQKDAVEFHHTPWGYWYTSGMSWGRLLQFGCVIAAMVTFYIILAKGFKTAKRERERYIYKGYIWFGPILFVGYLLDTLFPSLFNTAAIPGSAVSAFFSTLLLHKLCKEYNAYGISAETVSQYVLRDVNIPVIVTDDQKQIALYNKCVPMFFDCEEGEFKNSRVKLFLQGVCENFKKQTEEAAADTEIIQYTSSERGMIEFKLACTDVRDRFGELMYSIFFVQDVTRDQANLRTIEESRRMAEEANMAKSNFLANMSHEIRTPMNAIIGLSEVIIQDDPANSSMENVLEIKSAANNLLGIINDILDISKIESGRYELIDDDYHLSSLINDVCAIIRVRVQELGLEFRLNIDETVPGKLYGDVNRVRQILINILGNAVKFTKQGSITLSIGWNGDEKAPVIRFDVTDTGIGIKQENLEEIFGVFNQVDTRRNRSIQGTGLGLAISRELARLMDGDITVDSVYNEGSTFHITLKQVAKEYVPLGAKTCDTLKNNTYSMATNNTRKQGIHRPGTKVLVVDDVMVNLKVAQKLLQKYDIHADIASSGKEAVEMTGVTKYDLIFMDHMMPEMDGIDTTKAIRSLPDGLCKDTPIIALTANALPEAKETFEKEGLQDFLAKPILPKSMDEIILKWTEGR